MINFPSRTATCKNHVVPSKGIGNRDNKRLCVCLQCFACRDSDGYSNPHNRFVYMYINKRERDRQTDRDRDRDRQTERDRDSERDIRSESRRQFYSVTLFEAA